ncbi:MAG: hypothetical protein ABII98_01450, partial [bacterium]
MSDDGKTINKDNVEELELVAKQDGAGEEERPMENLDDILNPVSKHVTGAVDGVVEAGKSMGEPDEELNKLTDEAKQLEKNFWDYVREVVGIPLDFWQARQKALKEKNLSLPDNIKAREDIHRRLTTIRKKVRQYQKEKESLRNVDYGKSYDDDGRDIAKFDYDAIRREAINSIPNLREEIMHVATDFAT